MAARPRDRASDSQGALVTVASSVQGRLAKVGQRGRRSTSRPSLWALDAAIGDHDFEIVDVVAEEDFRGRPVQQSGHPAGRDEGASRGYAHDQFEDGEIVSRDVMTDSDLTPVSAPLQSLPREGASCLPARRRPRYSPGADSSSRSERDAHTVAEGRVVQLQLGEVLVLGDVVDDDTGDLVARVDVLQERLRALVGVDRGHAVG